MNQDMIKISGLKSKLSALKVRYESTRKRSLNGDKLLDQIKKITMKKAEEVRMAKQATQNLYQVIYKRKQDMDKINDKNAETHLLCIKRTLSQLNSICNFASVKNDRELSSVDVQISLSSSI